jgi:hypothetical protein
VTDNGEQPRAVSSFSFAVNQVYRLRYGDTATFTRFSPLRVPARSWPRCDRMLVVELKRIIKVLSLPYTQLDPTRFLQLANVGLGQLGSKGSLTSHWTRTIMPWVSVPGDSTAIPRGLRLSSLPTICLFQMLRTWILNAAAAASRHTALRASSSIPITSSTHQHGRRTRLFWSTWL